jgi:hypothetical protein
MAELFLTEYKTMESKLLKIYADLPVNLLNAAGFTPLMLAANSGERTLIKTHVSACFYFTVLCCHKKK